MLLPIVAKTYFVPETLRKASEPPSWTFVPVDAFVVHVSVAALYA